MKLKKILNCVYLGIKSERKKENIHSHAHYYIEYISATYAKNERDRIISVKYSASADDLMLIIFLKKKSLLDHKLDIA